MKQKQLVIIGGIVVALLGVGGFAAYKQLNKPAAVVATPAPQKKKITEPVNIIPVAERPVLHMVPGADGRRVTVVVDAVKKDAALMDFELEYNTENLIQGGAGQIDLAKLPAQKEFLLGSCSAGGACTYHKDVTGGTLLARFQGPENYAVKNDWRFTENKKKETTFSSKDAKFTLTSDELKQVSYAVVYNSPGFYQGISGTPASDIYAVSLSGTVSKPVQVSVRAAEEGSLKLLGWDGKVWQDLKAEVDGKMVKATAPLMQLYLVTKN
ncbi:hypothetical protein KA078_01290 [Candidatus Woesebacteria bacterium]|nr:hypothetical protein [Candidatus Woesebacteria bacterium]